MPTLNRYRITVRTSPRGRFLQWIRFAPSLAEASESAKRAAAEEGFLFIYAEPTQAAK